MDKWSSEDMKIQTEHIWSMLDDMAANDPAAYRKFIDKQMNEGKEALAPPNPHMCVQTTIYKPKTVLFINFCGWTRIPEPKSEQDAIPVIGGNLETVKQINTESYKQVAVAFNPKVLEEFGRNAKNVEETKALVELAIDYLKDQHGLDISKHFQILSEDTILKGSVHNMRQSFKAQSVDDKKFEDDLSELEKTFGPSASGLKNSLLKELSSISKGDIVPNKQTRPDVTIGVSDNSKAFKSELIEEVRGTPLCPEYQMTIKDDCMVLTVQLPGVHSVAVCQLDISEDDVCLCVPEKFNLSLQLPHLIQDDQSSAKFNKKLEELTITMPVKS